MSRTTALVTDGPFDAAASIEMGEHVGRATTIRRTRAILHDCVRPGGRVLIQQMSRRGKHPGGGPFIESFIAPDMHMRPLGETIASARGSRTEHGGGRGDAVNTMCAPSTPGSTISKSALERCGSADWRGGRPGLASLPGGRTGSRSSTGRMGVDQILLARPGALVGSDARR